MSVHPLGLPGHPNPARLVYQSLANGIRPPEALPFSQWLPRNLKLVDGPAAGELWRADGAPYLVEIADCLSDDDPCNLVTVRKSQQSGASILALGWCLYIADREPANVLYGCPGLDALREMNSAKLAPLIDAWHGQIKRTVVVPQTSRSGRGSTTYEKVYPGGRLFLANANSVMDLSGKTIKKGVKDELSKWETLDNGADPETLFFGRFTVFRRARNWKILEISTPEVDSGDELAEAEGHCRIDRSFRRSDQRFWNVPCPECGSFFVHAFERLQVDIEHPHRSAYDCPHCHHFISDAERIPAIRAGHWEPTIAGPDRHPGFHIDAFISPMMGYGDIAEDSLRAKSEIARKDFSNLVLGLPYQFRGDAPDHMRLMERRGAYKPNFIPPGALLLCVGCDVQKRGIYAEVLAFAPDRQSWVVFVDYIDGATTDVTSGAFLGLTELYHRLWPDAYGNKWRPDEFGIDANYNTSAVFEWTRRHPGTKALQGRDGWGRPALSVATDQDVDYQGRKIRGGAKLRGVGTWPLKSTFYAYLAQQPIAEGSSLIYPPGFCHFHEELDENYFKQITAEYLGEETYRGRKRQRWIEHAGRENHFLDCRIYNMALAEAYFQSLTADDWANMAKERGIPADLRAADLFAQRPFAPSHLKAAEGTTQDDAKSSQERDPFAGLERLNQGL